MISVEEDATPAELELSGGIYNQQKANKWA